MRLPPSTRWARAASEYIKPADIPGTFHCPDAKSPFSYVFNVHLDRLPTKHLANPAETVMFYEGDATELNAAGDGTSIPIATRHNVDASHIGYADGHVRSRRQASFQELDWGKKPQ